MKTPPILSFVAIAAMLAGTSQTFAAGPAADVITFAAPKPTYATGGTIALAGKTKSGASVIYSTTTPDFVSISGATATMKKAGGPVSITATAARPADLTKFTQAPPVTVSFTIAQAKAPAFTATADSLKPTYAPNGTITITPGKLPNDFGSGPIGYAVTGPISAVNAGTGIATITGAGAATVTVTPPASVNYGAPKPVVLKIAIAKANNVIHVQSAFSIRPNASSTIAIPGYADSKDSIVYKAGGKACNVAGNILTPITQNPVKVTADTVSADDAGNANYNKATTVKIAITVDPNAAPNPTPTPVPSR